MKNKAKQSTPVHAQRSATKAYAEHATAVSDMMEDLQERGWGKSCLDANWGDVADMGEAREKMVMLMIALGHMTIDEANEKHNMEL